MFIKFLFVHMYNSCQPTSILFKRMEETNFSEALGVFKTVLWHFRCKT